MPRPTNLYAVFLISFAINPLTSCFRDSKRTSDIIQSLEEGLKKSDKIIKQKTEEDLKSLEDKTTRPETKERADYWFPVAKRVTELSSEISGDIENLKELKKIDFASSERLYNQIREYTDSILNAEAEIKLNFEKTLFLTSMLSQYQDKTSKEFYNKNFKNSASYLISPTLTKFQNEISIAANKITKFCLNKIGMVDGPGFYETFSAIIGQNSTILKPGEVLKIEAGIGAFSKSQQPVIFINGKNVTVGEEGFSSFKMKVPDKPGKYRVPVRIKFFNTIGKEEEHSYKVNYTVAKPCDQ
ncbi:MAG: hypothetical protein ACT4OJ_07185 [Bacteroidota bacterium]